MEVCGGCAVEVSNPAACWSCASPLCRDCWERFGICVAATCIQNERDLANATTQEERVAIIARLGTIRPAKARRPIQ
jgi:hypothetical protein